MSEMVLYKNILQIAKFSPIRTVFPDGWIGHLPFATWIIQSTKPKIFVELGTHSGNSYFAFCQAVLEGNFATTRCYAVDTWLGDEHAGKYDETIFEDVNSFNQENYRAFSYLLRMTFDDALNYFSDESVDLLHIDGMHTYEAVKHDFYSWLPKLSPGAIVLFHDTNVRENNFGVWKLFEELKNKYPNNLEFIHSHGLGVIQVKETTSSNQYPWLTPENECQLLFKTYFSALGTLHQKQYNLNQRVIEQSASLRTNVIQIDNLENSITERDAQIVDLYHTIGRRDQQINKVNDQINKLNDQINRLNDQIDEQNIQITDLEAQLVSLFNSKSWKITKPLRDLKKLITSKTILHCFGSRGARYLWHLLPIPLRLKHRIKHLFFKTFPFLFRHTAAYKNWLEYQQPISCTEPRSYAQPPSLYVPLLNASPLKKKPVKAICFYLPQFHPIPENDAWWGKGFTEWTNVQPALPQFLGHYQPHIPGELGYYNLLDRDIMRRQIDLAKLYGLGGFCFYFYWFDSVLILEKPLENYLQDPSLDFPFCLCWANENWSRRWDGLDQEILIAQNHSAEDDLAFISHVARYMRDPRYIKINGKPLLLVYRPEILPSAKQTSQRWRQWCHENGIGDIYLAYTQSFEAVDPLTYGFDAAIEFPPNISIPPYVTNGITPLKDDFNCLIYDWSSLFERSQNYTQPAYKLFRSVCPSWDNTARRKNCGTIFVNNDPETFQHWLENAIDDTLAHQKNFDEQLIFINAWNEWAEGAHLEPDVRYGYAWLQAVRNALSGKKSYPNLQRKIILVAHDAYPHGAQILAVNLAKTLSQDMGFLVDLVCLGDGPLVDEYCKWATVYKLTEMDSQNDKAQTLAQKLYAAGHRYALVNTTVSGLFLQTLSEAGIQCTALIHELKGVLDQNQLHSHAQAIATHAHKIVFPANDVATSFDGVAPGFEHKYVIRPQGLYKRRHKSDQGQTKRALLRQKLGLPENAQIMLGVGYADHRKGVDLFVATGLAMKERLPNAYWVWVGHWEPNMQEAIEKQLCLDVEFNKHFVFPGLQENTDIFYDGADIFVLTSREDPFPSVVLEAMDAGLPIVGFHEAGGFGDLLQAGCGHLVEKENILALGEKISDLLEQPDLCVQMGKRGMELIHKRFSFRHYVFDLLDLLGLGLDRVSVIVPNYNYAQFLPERLQSIIKQTYPIFEIIFLDDCSQDESLHIAETLLYAQKIDFRIISNTENSGSVFQQWKKGADLAQGSHIWIAEADDCCHENFLSETLTGFRTPNVVLSYCESQQIDETGNILAHNYLDYISDLDTRRWMTPFVLNADQAAQFFCVKNIIPNVSAVLFKTKAISTVLTQDMEEILSYRIAGDWLVYVLLLKQGLIAFTPEAKNMHRRHQDSVTLKSFNITQLKEIQNMQTFVANNYSVSSEMLTIAKEYIEKLTKQFNLDQIN